MQVVGRAHGREIHLGKRTGWLRAAVLGADDGIVSTASLVIGVAASDASTTAVVTAGLAGLVAGAMSMAAGEYVSVASQRDVERADLRRETDELAASPDAELDELTAIYESRGLEHGLARQVAERLTKVTGSPFTPATSSDSQIPAWRAPCRRQRRPRSRSLSAQRFRSLPSRCRPGLPVSWSSARRHWSPWAFSAPPARPPVARRGAAPSLEYSRAGSSQCWQVLPSAPSSERPSDLCRALVWSSRLAGRSRQRFLQIGVRPPGIPSANHSEAASKMRDLVHRLRVRRRSVSSRAKRQQ